MFVLGGVKLIDCFICVNLRQVSNVNEEYVYMFHFISGWKCVKYIYITDVSSIVEPVTSGTYRVT
jgi:hypothetical protein